MGSAPPIVLRLVGREHYSWGTSHPGGHSNACPLVWYGLVCQEGQDRCEVGVGLVLVGVLISARWGVHEHLAIRAVIIDALNERAAHWHASWGFKPLPGGIAQSPVATYEASAPASADANGTRASNYCIVSTCPRANFDRQPPNGSAANPLASPQPPSARLVVSQ